MHAFKSVKSRMEIAQAKFLSMFTLYIIDVAESKDVKAFTFLELVFTTCSYYTPNMVTSH